jgi:hypothetical protein
MNYAHDIINKLKQLRNNYIETFSSIFQKANKLRKIYFNSEILCPRIKKKKTKDTEIIMIVKHRKNTIEHRYLVPSIDGFILNLENHFRQNNIILSSIEILLPKYALNENVSTLKNLNIFYEYYISEKVVCSEFLLWCEKWVNIEKNPLKLWVFWIHVMHYPNIHFFIENLGNATSF